MKKKNLFRPLVLALAMLIIWRGSFLFAFPRGGQLKNTATEVHWYTIMLGDQKVGYYQETVEKIQKDDLLNYKTITESRIVFNRLGKRIELIFNSEYLETEDGSLKKIISDQLMSSQLIKIEAEVQEGKVLLKSTAGGRTFSRELPYTGKLLGPEGIRQLTLRSLKKTGDKLEFKTLVAELSQVVAGERNLISAEELEHKGEKIKVMKIEEKLSSLAYTSVVWLDSVGLEIKSVEPSPFGDMVTLLSTEEEALSGMREMSLNQDQYRVSLVKANCRLPQARQLDRVVIRLKHKKPELGWPEIQNEYQKIIKQDKETMVLELNRVALRPVQESKKKISAEELSPYLKANAYIDPEDPEIKRVAQEVVGSEKDVFQKAVKLRDWVAKNMTFDLGLVFAPSSEIIKNKRGTCAGYAALLAALLRSGGLASRYLFGLAYAQGIWGGHAWVEAWIDGQWIPLDAAIPGPGAADPARLAIAWSSLDEGFSESLSAAQKIFGNVEIEILEYSLRGKTFKVEAGKPAYEVKDRTYQNFGLQISLVAPVGFTFEDLDKVWPDKTLLTLKGPEGELVNFFQEGWFPAENFEQFILTRLKKEVNEGQLVYEKVWGKRRPMIISPGRSAVALVNGVDFIILTAQGKNSSLILRAVLKNFQNGLIVN